MINPMSIDLPGFLGDWYGPPCRPVAPLPESCSWLPAPLRGWHEVSSQWLAPLMTIKRMLAPESIVALEGKAIFMADAGDAIWSFDVDCPSRIYEGRLHEGWTRSSENLTEFLIHNALHEAAFNAKSKRACEQVELVHLDRILAPMSEVSFGGWGWPRPGHKIFLGDGLIADVGPAMEDRAPWGNKDGFVEVQLGGNEPDRISYVDQISDIHWFRSGQS
ncbi:hypothetical protein GCM10022284_75100 [Streptomyces hundungensis]